MADGERKVGLILRSSFFAIAVHVILLFALVFTFYIDPGDVDETAMMVVEAEPIQAKAVSEQHIQEQLQKIKQQERLKRLEETKRKRQLELIEKKKLAAEKKRILDEQRLAELKKQRAEEEEKVRIAEEKRKKEQERLADLKLEQEKLRKDQEKRIQEEKLRLAEIKRQEDLGREQEKIRVEKENQKRLVEKKRRLEAERQKKLAEEKSKREKEQRRIAEAKRLKDLADKRRLEQIARQKEIERQRKLVEQRRVEWELQAKMERERSRRRAATEFGKYRTIIREKVSRNWNRPTSARSGLKAVVLVKVRPSGEVISARVVTGSGNPIFDRSVENAILKASPLPIPNDRTLFEYFKEFLFEFKPDSKLVSLQ